jgi:hypothetical protein
MTQPCGRSYYISAAILLHSHHHAQNTLTSHTLTMLQFQPDSENYTLLFTLATSSAAVELGLTAYLMIAGSHVGGVLYHSLFVLSPRFVLNKGSTFNFIVDRLFSSLMHFGPCCSSQHACYGLREAASICWLIYLAQFFGFSPRHLSGYYLAMPCHTRCLSPVLQGSAIGWVHNTRARKSCRAIPSDSRYIGRLVPVANADSYSAASITYLLDPSHGWSLRSA